MFGHTYNKKLFIGYQKSKFNWALYTLPGNPIAESIDFFFFSCGKLPYGLFVNWAEDKGIQGHRNVNVHWQFPRSLTGFLLYTYTQNF